MSQQADFGRRGLRVEQGERVAQAPGVVVGVAHHPELQRLELRCLPLGLVLRHQAMHRGAAHDSNEYAMRERKQEAQAKAAHERLCAAGLPLQQYVCKACALTRVSDAGVARRRYIYMRQR